MQLNRKTRIIIAIAIAGIFILYGTLGQLLNINIDTKTLNNVSLVLMVIAFILLFGGKKPNKENTEDKNTEAKNKENQINTLEAGDADNHSDGDNSGNT